MGMGEDNGVDFRGGDIELFPVAQAELFITLE